MIKQGKIVRQTAKNIEEKILCAYENISNSWQIIKITDLPNLNWEKVVPSGQKIVFQTSKKANLKVLTANNITNMLVDTIPCKKLAID